MTERKEPVVGILGGMGPEATVELMRRIVARTPAQRDQDHIRCIVDQNGGVPNRVTSIRGTGAPAGPVLADMARRLAAWGADMLCMPCNTAHHYMDDIKAAAPLPFVDMLECTAARVRERFPEAKTAAVLCTVGTRETGLYENRLTRHGIDAVYPPPMQQEMLTTVIAAVKAGDTGPKVREDFLRVIRHMHENGAPVCIAACTELSVICPDSQQAPNVVDALDALVDALITNVKGSSK